MPNLSLTRTQQSISGTPGSQIQIQNLGGPRAYVSESNTNALGAGDAIASGGIRYITVPASGILYLFADDPTSVSYGPYTVSNPAPAKTGASYPDDTTNAALLGARGTSPAARWASCDATMIVDQGAGAGQQNFATRVRARLAPGRWKAIAPVYVIACQQDGASPIARGLNTPSGKLRWSIELPDGVQTTDFTSPNTGSTILQGLNRLVRDVAFSGGAVIVGDLRKRDDGQPFDATDRLFEFWLRTAWGKDAASTVLMTGKGTGYNFPSNSHFAQCDSYAAACALIDQPGLVGYNGGLNKWGAGSPENLPTCVGFVGIAMDGQVSIGFFGGTSIPQGQGDAFSLPDGTSPASYDKIPAAYDLIGFPMRAAQSLTGGFPCLAYVVGGSSSGNLWGEGSAVAYNTSPSGIALQRFILRRLAPYFDAIVLHDPTNDAGQGISATDYRAGLRTASQELRSASPGVPLFALRVPNGGTAVDGSAFAYNTAMDAYYAAQTDAVTAGDLNGVIDVRSSGANLYPNAGVVVTSTLTANASGSNLTDTTRTFRRNQWANAYIVVNGVQRAIQVNERTTMGLDAPFPTDPVAGTTYTIVGNGTRDGLHGTAYWNQTVAPARLVSELSAKVPGFKTIARVS